MVRLVNRYPCVIEVDIGPCILRFGPEHPEPTQIQKRAGGLGDGFGRITVEREPGLPVEQVRDERC